MDTGIVVASRLDRESDLIRRPIAHRGMHSKLVPENSLAAFQWAVECELPIECDVQLLSDGQIAIYHDFALGRLTVDTRDLTTLTAHEATSLRLGTSEERIPLLRDLLSLVQGRVPLLIELKSRSYSGGKLEAAVVAELEQYAGEFALQSFQYMSIAWLKSHAPHLCRGQLASGTEGLPHYQETLPDFVAYELDSLPHQDTTRLRNGGVPLLVWTITTRADQARAAEVADNYIFNQNPELMDSIAPTVDENP